MYRSPSALAAVLRIVFLCCALLSRGRLLFFLRSILLPAGTGAAVSGNEKPTRRSRHRNSLAGDERREKTPGRLFFARFKTRPLFTLR